MARRAHKLRGPKRLTSWFQFQPVEITFTAVGGAIFGTLNAAALALRPFTIVRTHLELQLQSDQAAAVERQFACFGACIVSEQATGVGVAAVPTPFTDMGSELWFVHKVLYGDESKLTDKATSATRVSIDSKAMRKVNEGEDLAFVGEFATGGAGFQMVAGGRFLVKLH